MPSHPACCEGASRWATKAPHLRVAWYKIGRDRTAEDREGETDGGGEELPRQREVNPQERGGSRQGSEVKLKALVLSFHHVGFGN